MRITDSAFKHGVQEADIWHAVRMYLRVHLDQGVSELAMFIGPARDGQLLEVGVIEDDEDPRIVHAMPARARFL